MMNLFSTFNPITSHTWSMNWMILMVPMALYTTMMWNIHSKNLLTNKIMNQNITKQFKPSLKKISFPNMAIFNTIMITLLLLNITSLLPNTFSATSHIMINLASAMTLWITLMLNKASKMKTLMANLTPSGTPMILIPFMVMIELTSMMIQPLTLSIRLSANLTAGHIMMILITQMYTLMLVPTLMLNMMMMILELGVSIIQAYVFSMLIIMYSK